MHQCNIFMSAFDQQIEVKKTLSYCGANIWNYILNKVNPKYVIGSFKNLSKICSCFQMTAYSHDLGHVVASLLH